MAACHPSPGCLGHPAPPGEPGGDLPEVMHHWPPSRPRSGPRPSSALCHREPHTVPNAPQPSQSRLAAGTVEWVEVVALCHSRGHHLIPLITIRWCPCLLGFMQGRVKRHIPCPKECTVLLWIRQPKGVIHHHEGAGGELCFWGICCAWTGLSLSLDTEYAYICYHNSVVVGVAVKEEKVV